MKKEVGDEFGKRKKNREELESKEGQEGRRIWNWFGACRSWLVALVSVPGKGVRALPGSEAH